LSKVSTVRLPDSIDEILHYTWLILTGAPANFSFDMNDRTISIVWGTEPYTLPSEDINDIFNSLCQNVEVTDVGIGGSDGKKALFEILLSYTGDIFRPCVWFIGSEASVRRYLGLSGRLNYLCGLPCHQVALPENVLLLGTTQIVGQRPSAINNLIKVTIPDMEES